MASEILRNSTRACARVFTLLLLAMALFVTSSLAQTSYPVVLAPGASGSIMGSGSIWYSPNSSNASCTGAVSDWTHSTFFNAGSDINLFRVQVEGINTSPATPIYCAGSNGNGFTNNTDNSTIHHYNFTIKMSDPVSTGTGQRYLTITVEGLLYTYQVLASGLDPYASVGQGQPLTVSYSNVAVKDSYFHLKIDGAAGRPLLASLIIEKVD